MRAVLLTAAAFGIALALMPEGWSVLGLLGLPPRVTCSLPAEACPELFWSGGIHWTNDTSTISSIEFRELPPDWRGHRSEIPFEPEWAALVEAYFDPTQAAACHSDAGDLVCQYIEYGGDLEDLPWAERTPEELQKAWCRAEENKASIFAAANELDLRQGQDRGIVQEYNAWQDSKGRFTENLVRACQAAYASR
jgi:hypothetical protein